MDSVVMVCVGRIVFVLLLWCVLRCPMSDVMMDGLLLSPQTRHVTRALYLQRAFISRSNVVLPPDTRVRHPMKEMENVLQM